MTMGARTVPRISEIRSSTPRRFVPDASALSVARWMTGPSARGSENGTPTSRMSAPARSSACTMAPDRARSGSPAVTYVTRPGRRSARSRANVSAMRDIECLLHRLNVLVSASRQIDEQYGIASQMRRDLDRVRDRVRRFESRQDPFELGESLKRVERFRVGDVRVFGAAERAQPRVLGPHRGVIESRRNRMRQLDVAVVVLQHERAGSLRSEER